MGATTSGREPARDLRGPGAASEARAIIRAYAGVWPRIHPDAWIAPGAIVLDGAEVGAGALIGAGSVVTPGTVIPRALGRGRRPRQARARAHRRRTRGAARARARLRRHRTPSPRRRRPGRSEAPPRREQKKAESRRRILEAAREVFFRDGFMPANLDEVAELAQVAKGTLYRYFDSKAELYVAVLAHDGAIFERKLRETLAPELSPPNRSGARGASISSTGCATATTSRSSGRSRTRR